VVADKTITRTCDVALVSMPWAPPLEPCLGLGILKSCLTRAGISSRVFHFAGDLLRWLKHDTYQYMADSWGLNDFVFTAALDPVFGERQREAVVNRVLKYFKDGRRYDAYPSPESVLDLFMYVRHQIVREFLENAADRIVLFKPKIVGFTCLFDQTMASLALAAKLKSIDPTLTVVFGGYALEGSPGDTVARGFSDIDFLVQGDGEQAIVDLAQLILGNGKFAPPTLPCARPADLVPLTPSDTTVNHLVAGASSERIIRALRYDLDNSPTPDYDDWYEDLEVLEESHKIHVETAVLPVESSRGCWWGQNKHCVFCGIDDESLTYRYKEPSRTLQMLSDLRERYGDVTFRFSDYIMPKVYYSELLPRLASHRPRFRLHSEIKANHPPERIRLLVDAGFVAVQPGVESFSTPVLRSMEKGIRGIDNVCLLKTAYVEHLVTYYNILYGLPDDSVVTYEAMLEMLPRIYHLMPPISRTETMVTRFAPLHTASNKFGIRKPVHHECYDVLFSDQFIDNSGFSLDDYGYFFERNFDYSEELRALYNQLVLQVDYWKKQHQTRFVELSYAEAQGGLTISDSRFSPQTYTLSAAASTLYKRLDDRPKNINLVLQELNSTGRLAMDDARTAFCELNEARLIWEEDAVAFGLAVPKVVADAHREAHWPQQWVSIYI
jgi:ribosomal peptide maturation radical SAM protein 1